MSDIVIYIERKELMFYGVKNSDLYSLQRWFSNTEDNSVFSFEYNGGKSKAFLRKDRVHLICLHKIDEPVKEKHDEKESWYV